MVNSEYLKNLNNAQKEAVLHLDGPLLIVAGAGSGKTKVLTSRIAHIIREKKAFPNQILAVTFTNNKQELELHFRVCHLSFSSLKMLYQEPLKILRDFYLELQNIKEGHCRSLITIFIMLSLAPMLN